MNLSSLQFANGLIRFYNEAGYGVMNHLRLQKLIHVIHYWYVKTYKKNDLINELPEGWMSGYTYRSVYETFINYNDNIPICNIELGFYDIMSDNNITDDVKEFISDVVMSFAHVDTFNIIRVSENLHINDII